jgi:sulfur-carrier protein
MRVTVRFFASLRAATGMATLDLQLPEQAGSNDLLRALQCTLDPAAFAALRADRVRLALNQDLVAPPFALGDGDEVAFLPPVTGG